MENNKIKQFLNSLLKKENKSEEELLIENVNNKMNDFKFNLYQAHFKGYFEMKIKLSDNFQMIKELLEKTPSEDIRIVLLKNLNEKLTYINNNTFIFENRDEYTKFSEKHFPLNEKTLSLYNDEINKENKVNNAIKIVKKKLR